MEQATKFRFGQIGFIFPISKGNFLVFVNYKAHFKSVALGRQVTVHSGALV